MEWIIAFLVVLCLLEIYSIRVDVIRAHNEKMKALSQEEILVKNQLKQAKDKNYKAETTLEQIKNTFLCANKAEKAYCEAKDDTRRELVKTLLWNISIKEQKIASYRLKMPYQLLIGGPKITDFSTLHGIEESNLCQRFWRP